MNAQQNYAFSELVRVWNKREDARHAGNIRALNEASVQLDQQRSLTHAMLGLR